MRRYGLLQQLGRLPAEVVAVLRPGLGLVFLEFEKLLPGRLVGGFRGRRRQFLFRPVQLPEAELQDDGAQLALQLR